MDFAVSADHRVKIDKYLDRELKKKQKLGNMNMTEIPIIVFETFSKSLEKRLVELKIRRRIRTISTIALLKLAKILRRLVIQTPVKEHQLTLV